MSEMRDGNVILTHRLELRPLTAADAPALVAGCGSLEVSRWLTNVPHPYTNAAANAFIAFAGTRPDHWAIIWRERLVGMISTGSELGYWLAPDAWGKGVATEAAIAVTHRWFADPEKADLSASHFAENAASAAVLRKVGFDHTGDMRDQISVARGAAVRSRMMNLTRTGWDNRRTLPDLTTPRTTTRPLAAEDAARLSEIAGIPEVARNTSSIPAPWSEAQARRWIEQGFWAGNPGFRLAICDRSGVLIGMAGLSPQDKDGASSVAYLIEKSLWGRGIVSEVMAALIPAVFLAFPLSALTADHYKDNPASGRVLGKLGFDKFGQGMGTSLARLEPAPRAAPACPRG